MKNDIEVNWMKIIKNNKALLTTTINENDNL